jgi:hypothetical protein
MPAYNPANIDTAALSGQEPVREIKRVDVLGQKNLYLPA